MVSILKVIAFVIISPIIAFFLTFLLAVSLPGFSYYPMPESFLVISTIIIFVLLNLRFNRSARRGKGESSTKISAWGPPEDIRDRVVTTPQFVGRFDRARGLLEATARMIQLDSVPY